VGNRFEFRAVGSSQNPAVPITALNAIMADSLDFICNEVDRKVAENVPIRDAVDETILETLKEHSRIIYNGDCYDQVFLLSSLFILLLI
jgi:glutamine synthetase